MNKKEELLRELLAMERESPTKKISQPSDAVNVMLKWASKPQEHFMVMSLDGGHKVIKTRVITKGLINRTLVHPREVFRGAIKDNSAAVIIGHNHPSGRLDPSPEDNEITDRMKQAGNIIGIPVLDHIIVSKDGYYSYQEEGMI